jgi:hypothetical protein
MVNLGDSLLGKIPANITAIAGKKKGRGRPRKIVQKEGIFIHKEPESLGHKMLTPKIRHDVRFRYKQLQYEYPGITIAGSVTLLSQEFKLKYSQIYQLVV